MSRGMEELYEDESSPGTDKETFEITLPVKWIDKETWDNEQRFMEERMQEIYDDPAYQKLYDIIYKRVQELFKKELDKKYEK